MTQVLSLIPTHSVQTPHFERSEKSFDQNKKEAQIILHQLTDQNERQQEMPNPLQNK